MYVLIFVPVPDVEPPKKVEKVVTKALQRICYTRDFLLNCSRSPHAQQALPNWWNIARQHPGIARKVRSNVQDFTRLPVPQCRPLPNTEPLSPLNPNTVLESDDYDHIIEQAEALFDSPELSDIPLNNDLNLKKLTVESPCSDKPTAFSSPRQPDNLYILNNFVTGLWD